MKKKFFAAMDMAGMAFCGAIGCSAGVWEAGRGNGRSVELAVWVTFGAYVLWAAYRWNSWRKP